MGEFANVQAANVRTGNPGNDGATSLIRVIAVLTILAPVTITLAGCGPSYSPDTYATNAAQQANKVDVGVIAGVRPVQISASGAVGGVAGAAAGGVAGSQAGMGPTSAFGAIGGSVIGGLAGVASEHLISDTKGFEYVVRKANGEMISVAQNDEKPLRIGQRVLVIAGPQARIVPDYTVPFEEPSKSASQPPVEASPSHPTAAPGATTPPSPVTPSLPVTSLPAPAGVPPQLPAAFGAPSTPPPAIVTPLEVPAAVAPPGSASKP